MPVDRFGATQLRGQQLYWLLDIAWGGRVLRLSTTDLAVQDAQTGRTLHYAGALDEVQFSDGLELLEDNSGQTSLPVECVLPLDAAAMRAAGHRLEWARAELSRWIAGSDYGERRVMMVGQVKDPAIAADGEPSAFSIEDNYFDDAALIPASTARVDGTTWSTVDSLLTEELGLFYPLIFGYPGQTPKAPNNGAWVTGSQGVWVDHTDTDGGGGSRLGLRLVIAGHPVKATRVILNTDASPDGFRFAVLQGQDDRGQAVSYVDAWADAAATNHQVAGGDADGEDAYGLGSATITSDFQPTPTQFVPVFVAWYVPVESGAVSGGMIGPSGDVVREAGDVLEVMLSYTSLPVDRGRLAAAKPLLRRFLVDCVIDEQVQPWAWVQSNLLPLLPISITSGPDGIYPVVLRYDATVADAVCTLNVDADPRICRAGRIVTDSSKIKNDITLEYAYSVRTDNYIARVRAHGGSYDRHDPDAHPNYHCRLSQQRYKNRDGTPYIAEQKLQSVCVYDPGTAEAIVAWQARAYALAQERIDYLVPEAAFDWLQRGSPVQIIDSEMGLRRVALIEDIQTDDSGQLALRLLLLTEPMRELLAAAA